MEWPRPDPIYVEITTRLLTAIAVGGAVGIERTHRGRPAGFRTHALVAMSTALLMLVTVYEEVWFPRVSQGRVTLDPTRMAQGIMTGIGFLGAGAILREGLNVRGLTTAASIWITAAMGVLIGIGFTFPALVAAGLTLTVLAVFRWVEDRIPTPFHARVVVRFKRTNAPTEQVVRDLLGDLRLVVASLAYRVDSKDDFFEYRMVVRSQTVAAADHLAARLSEMPGVEEFRVAPTVD
jgi:putative Mg2+ transporter-C (MgtC) family protein